MVEIAIEARKLTKDFARGVRAVGIEGAGGGNEQVLVAIAVVDHRKHLVLDVVVALRVPLRDAGIERGGALPRRGRSAPPAHASFTRGSMTA
mgnify:CR=1 FL=1